MPKKSMIAAAFSHIAGGLLLGSAQLRQRAVAQARQKAGDAILSGVFPQDSGESKR